MKKNENKVTNLISNKVAEQLEALRMQSPQLLRLLKKRPKRLKRNW